MNFAQLVLFLFNQHDTKIGQNVREEQGMKIGSFMCRMPTAEYTVYLEPVIKLVTPLPPWSLPAQRCRLVGTGAQGQGKALLKKERGPGAMAVRCGAVR